MLNDLTATQRELADYMSALSERAYDAGWVEGLEFALWRAVADDLFKYGQLELSREHAQQLSSLSQRCGGWIVFDKQHEESFVTLEQWLHLLATMRPSQSFKRTPDGAA